MLASLGFWPGWNENMEGVVVVITGIKRATSQLINVENVNDWLARDKGPPSALSALPPHPHIVGSLF